MRYMNKNKKDTQAPGKSFRKGITLMELFKMFPDNDTAEKWFESRIWRDGRRCPTCNNPDTKEAKHPRFRDSRVGISEAQSDVFESAMMEPCIPVIQIVDMSKSSVLSDCYC